MTRNPLARALEVDRIRLDAKLFGQPDRLAATLPEHFGNCHDRPPRVGGIHYMVYTTSSIGKGSLRPVEIPDAQPHPNSPGLRVAGLADQGIDLGPEGQPVTPLGLGQTGEALRIADGHQVGVLPPLSHRPEYEVAILR
jgi:hypothetical protein